MPDGGPFLPIGADLRGPLASGDESRAIADFVMGWRGWLAEATSEQQQVASVRQLADRALAATNPAVSARVENAMRVICADLRLEMPQSTSQNGSWADHAIVQRRLQVMSWLDGSGPLPDRSASEPVGHQMLDAMCELSWGSSAAALARTAMNTPGSLEAVLGERYKPARREFLASGRVGNPISRRVRADEVFRAAVTGRQWVDYFTKRLYTDRHQALAVMMDDLDDLVASSARTRP